MTRLVRLYTAAQFEEVKTLVDLLAERSDLPCAERDTLTALQADLRQTAGALRPPPAAAASSGRASAWRRGGEVASTASPTLAGLHDLAAPSCHPNVYDVKSNKINVRYVAIWAI